MAETKKIVCLANSDKLGGRCIAGKEWTANGSGAWIRPVSIYDGGAVLPSEYGAEPKPRDILDIPLLKTRPENGPPYQSENWRLPKPGKHGKPRVRWKKHKRRATWKQLAALVDPVEKLWINGVSTEHGKNNQMRERDANKLTSSLRFIHVDKLTFHVLLREISRDGRVVKRDRLVNAIFDHDGVEYELRVTDPVYKWRYLAKENGKYCVDDCYLTISIGEPYWRYCHKLVAAIIEKPD